MRATAAAGPSARAGRAWPWGGGRGGGAGVLNVIKNKLGEYKRKPKMRQISKLKAWLVIYNDYSDFTETLK